MRRSLALLLLSTAACSGGQDVPEAFVGVDQADLAGAELPADVAAAAQAPLVDDALAVRFAADPALSADGDVETLMRDASATPRFGRDFLVAVRWGYFPPRPATDWVNWSGFVAVS